MTNTGRQRKRTAVKKGRQGNLIRLLFVAVIIYFLWTLISLRVQISQKQAQAVEYQQKIEAQRLANEELQYKINKGLSKQEIEQIARERLSYGKYNERVFINILGN